MKRILYITAALLFIVQLSLAQHRSVERRGKQETRNVAIGKKASSKHKRPSVRRQEKSSRIERATPAKAQRQRNVKSRQSENRIRSSSAQRNEYRLRKGNSRVSGNDDHGNIRKNKKIDRAKAQRQRNVKHRQSENRISSPSAQRNEYRSRKGSSSTIRNNNHVEFRKHKKNSYTRRSNRGSSHGHINQYYHNKRKVRNLYYNYKRVPAIRMVFHPRWHRFYSAHYSSYSHGYMVNRRLNLISGHAAKYHTGEVAAVFGRVYETYYDEIQDEFYLYFGAPYPQSDFTVVVTGREARKMRRYSPRYFIGRDFIVSGLITHWNGKPEIVINYSSQLKRY